MSQESLTFQEHQGKGGLVSIECRQLHSWDAGLIPAFFRIRPDGRKNPKQKGIKLQHQHQH